MECELFIRMLFNIPHFFSRSALEYYLILTDMALYWFDVLWRNCWLGVLLHCRLDVLWCSHSWIIVYDLEFFHYPPQQQLQSTHAIYPDRKWAKHAAIISYWIYFYWSSYMLNKKSIILLKLTVQKRNSESLEKKIIKLVPWKKFSHQTHIKRS